MHPEIAWRPRLPIPSPTARLHAVWEASPDAMAFSDAQGLVLDANPAYCSLYGYPRREIVGHDFAVIFPEAERQAARAQYRVVFASAEPGAVYQATVQRRDGSTRIVEARISFLAGDGSAVPPGARRNGSAPAGLVPQDAAQDTAPGVARFDRRVAMLSIIRDITELVQAQREVLAAREREHAVIARLNDQMAQLVRELRQAAGDHQSPNGSPGDQGPTG